MVEMGVLVMEMEGKVPWVEDGGGIAEARVGDGVKRKHCSSGWNESDTRTREGAIIQPIIWKIPLHKE